MFACSPFLDQKGYLFAHMFSLFVLGCSGEVVVEVEKSKSSKKRIAKAPWAKLISQYSQVCYLL